MPPDLVARWRPALAPLHRRDPRRGLAALVVALEAMPLRLQRPEAAAVLAVLATALAGETEAGPTPPAAAAPLPAPPMPVPRTAPHRLLPEDGTGRSIDAAAHPAIADDRPAAGEAGASLRPGGQPAKPVTPAFRTGAEHRPPDLPPRPAAGADGARPDPAAPAGP
ncbi:hypothetical protein E2C05_32405, partial [Paracraurococcus ruber]